MNPLYYTDFFTPHVGALHIIFSSKAIHQISFASQTKKEDPSGLKPAPKKMRSKLIVELNAYFSGKRKKFKFKAAIVGSPFERAVLEEALKIPFGKVKTYKEIATAIGRPKAYRAVGNALGKNQVPVIIPCHRVVGASSLGGYSSGITIKRKLLTLEAGQNSLPI
jgi:methylated-DNA-[protein]-cysteine S-methyltransferase